MMLVTVALVMAAMVVSSAMPAFAAMSGGGGSGYYSSCSEDPNGVISAGSLVGRYLNGLRSISANLAPLI